jgi:3-methyladenine DNA glycosylase AlkD
MDPAAVSQQIEDELRALGTPERAEGEKAYLKSSLDFLGVTVWQIRRVVKAVVPEPSHDELVALVEELWSGSVFDRKLAAVFVLESCPELVEPSDLSLLERLIRDSGTWALVDGLAGDVMASLLVRHPSALPALDAWAADGDFWVRRSALLALRGPLKNGAPLDQFAGYADAMLDEKEFFIRKAIGWVLREVGKQRPDEVFAWLAPRTARTSGVTIREAVKYLKPEQRETLMTAYKDKRPATSGKTR